MSHIKRFFVYGTLRPDIRESWTDIVHKNASFKLTYFKAILRHSKLFFHKEIGYPICLYDPKKYSEHDVTHGYILETDNFEPTLKVLDEIENYPTEYDRILIECHNEDLEIPMTAHFYTRDPKQEELEHFNDISVNDWALYA
jgi:gamma-glutamylcyclotransferase (GGCT)/AIG2-like uncharacterized protein YtfP